MHTRSVVYTYLFVVVLLSSSTTGLELLDLDGDVGLALGVGELLGGVLKSLSFPVGGLFCGLECGVFTNGGVGVGVDFLNIIGTNTICEVGGELLLESVDALRYVKEYSSEKAYRSSSSSSRLSMYSATCPPKIYFLRTSASNVLDSVSYPGKRLSLWGM